MSAESLAEVFDLDGTLVQGEAFTAFLLLRLRGAPWRWPLAALALAVAAPQMLTARSRRRAASAVLWSVTAGTAEAPLLRQAVDHGRTRATPARQLPVPLERLRSALADGRTVVVLTACPGPVAAGVCEALGLDGSVTVLASPVRRRWGGWVLDAWLSGPTKADLVRWRYGPRVGAAYGDAVTDLPVLRLADRPVLVAPARRTVRVARRALGEVEVLDAGR